MKKRDFKKAGLILAASLALLLGGCGKNTPEKTVTGEAWSSDWTTLGDEIGVSSPEGFQLTRSEGLVTSGETYYYVWTKGEAVTYTSPEGDEKQICPCEIHLLAENTASSSKSEERIAEWNQLSEERYTFTDQFSSDYAGQTFAVTAYALPENGGPAALGSSASASRDSWAIHVDVTTLDEADPVKVMEEFLNSLHYAR